MKDSKKISEWLQQAKASGFDWADEALVRFQEKRNQEAVAESMAEALIDAFAFNGGGPNSRTHDQWWDIYEGLSEAEM